MNVSSHEDSAGEFGCAGSIFSTKLLGFVNKATKLMLTELDGQCRNTLLASSSTYSTTLTLRL